MAKKLVNGELVDVDSGEQASINAERSADLKVSRKVKITDSRNLASVIPYTNAKGTWDMDPMSQMLIRDALVNWTVIYNAAIADGEANMTWRMSDNTDVIVIQQDLQDVIDAVAERNTLVHLASRRAKAAIDLDQNPATVDLTTLGLTLSDLGL